MFLLLLFACHLRLVVDILFIGFDILDYIIQVLTIQLVRLVIILLFAIALRLLLIRLITEMACSHIHVARCGYVVVVIHWYGAIVYAILQTLQILNQVCFLNAPVIWVFFSCRFHTWRWSRLILCLSRLIWSCLGFLSFLHAILWTYSTWRMWIRIWAHQRLLKVLLSGLLAWDLILEIFISKCELVRSHLVLRTHTIYCLTEVFISCVERLFNSSWLHLLLIHLHYHRLCVLYLLILTHYFAFSTLVDVLVRQWLLVHLNLLC